MIKDGMELWIGRPKGKGGVRVDSVLGWIILLFPSAKKLWLFW